MWYAIQYRDFETLKARLAVFNNRETAETAAAAVAEAWKREEDSSPFLGNAETFPCSSAWVPNRHPVTGEPLTVVNDGIIPERVPSHIIFECFKDSEDLAGGYSFLY